MKIIGPLNKVPITELKLGQVLYTKGDDTFYLICCLEGSFDSPVGDRVVLIYEDGKEEGLCMLQEVPVVLDYQVPKEQWPTFKDAIAEIRKSL